MVRPPLPADFVRRVARRIASARTVRGMTQEALATALNTATKNVQRLESGGQNLTLRTIERVAAALGQPPESLCAGPSSHTSEPPRTSPSFASPLTRLQAEGYVVGAHGTRKPAGAVVVTTIAAAAGSLASRGSARASTLGWVRVPQARGVGWFVARVTGESMTPSVRDGSLCLFRPAVGSLPLGRIVLVEHRGVVDSELGGPYVLKRLARVEHRPGGKIRVTLASDNPEFPPLVVSFEDPDELRVVAELVQVLVAA